MGPRGAKTGIHFDSVDALLHQLHGTKRVTMWPPGERANLYPSTKYNHGAELSLVDFSEPNLTRHPNFRHASSISTHLTAGSAIYLPAGWWHAVSSLDASVSLALRSQSRCQAATALGDDFLLWLHNLGLYRRGNCVCHEADEV
jgi:ribosomal protein L16 Arg81 hydroxylase